MTCPYHDTPIPGCVGCLGRWDRAMAGRVLADQHGIEAATLRMALEEIDRLSRYDSPIGVVQRLRAADVAEWTATYEAMRAEIERLKAERAR